MKARSRMSADPSRSPTPPARPRPPLLVVTLCVLAVLILLFGGVRAPEARTMKPGIPGSGFRNAARDAADSLVFPECEADGGGLLLERFRLR